MPRAAWFAKWAALAVVVAALWLWIFARLLDGFAGACGRAVGM